MFARRNNKVLVVLSAVWVLFNMLSPLKNWYLTSNEVSNTDRVVITQLEWGNFLDYKFSKFLYENTGIDFDLPPNDRQCDSSTCI